MKHITISAVMVALAVPAQAFAADDPPKPKDAASAACKAERARMGAATFKLTYGTNRNRSNAFGKCVSKRTRTERAAQANAAKACKAEREDPNFAATHGGKTFNEFYGTGKKGRNAYGKCVSAKAKKSRDETTKAHVNAAKACKAERKADPAAFKAKYGTNRNKSNAFGKCVSQKARRPYSLPS